MLDIVELHRQIYVLGRTLGKQFETVIEALLSTEIIDQTIYDALLNYDANR
jgi:hypothetical protein